MLPLALTLATALAGEPNFPTRTFALPGQTHAVKIVDLNHDGAQDLLAVQNYAMKWLEGDGDGGFVDRGTVPGSLHWWPFEFADIDGDGWLDAIGKQGAQHELVHMAGDGTGGFTFGQRLDSGRYTKAHLADLDNDGDLDCVAWEYLTRTLRSFLRTSAGYVPGPVLPVSRLRYSEFELGDFDGDQRIDVAVAIPFMNSAGGCDYVILHGDGVGGFGARTIVGNIISGVFKAADVNGDGADELVCSTGAGIRAFRHAGARHYTQWILDPSSSLELQFEDADGDGDLDLFLGEPLAHHVRFNDGSGRFHQTLSLTTHFWGPGSNVGDVDGDGQPDLVGRLPLERIGVTRSIATLRPSQSVGRTTSTVASAAGDLDGDGHIDLLLQRPGMFELARGDGSGHFELSAQSGSLVYSPLHSVQLVDFDSDGDLDFAGRDSMDAAFAVPNDGTGRFGVPIVLPLPSAAKLAWADFDGDGRSDALVAAPGQFAVYRGVPGGLGLSSPATTFSAHTSIFTVADFDGDGRAEVVGWAPGTLRHFAWSASGSLAPAFSLPCPTKPVGICAGDVNGDGRSDLVWVTHAGAIRCAVSNGNGFAGTFSSRLEISPSVVGFTGFALVHMDRDPFLDLVAIVGAPYWGASLVVWPGKGNGHFAAPVTLTPTAPISLVKDLNGDGRADFALGAGAFVRPVVVLQD